MQEKKMIITGRYESPCGALKLGVYEGKLCLCDWETGRHRERDESRLMRELGAEMEEGSCEVMDAARRELDEYFAGVRQEFDIPLLFVGTEFQKRVWRGLLSIPYGQTESYGEMARRLGMPKSVRALANANGANGLSIFVPCHRVIGSDKTLTGYGGGLEVKEYLLKLEKEA